MKTVLALAAAAMIAAPAAGLAQTYSGIGSVNGDVAAAFPQIGQGPFAGVRGLGASPTQPNGRSDSRAQASYSGKESAGRADAHGATAAAYYGKGYVAPPYNYGQDYNAAPGQDDLVYASASAKSCGQWRWDPDRQRYVWPC